MRSSEIKKRWRALPRPSSKGGHSIERFKVSEFGSLRSAFQGSFVPEGGYTKLVVGGDIMMSDTPSERTDHDMLFERATGHVLVMGLGLGCCLNVLAGHEDVTRVTVVERDEHIIALVSPYFSKYEHIEFIHADAREYEPPSDAYYGAVWHDIWQDICPDNEEEMVYLMDRYADICGWQDCWSLRELADNGMVCCGHPEVGEEGFYD